MTEIRIRIPPRNRRYGDEFLERLREHDPRLAERVEAGAATLRTRIPAPSAQDIETCGTVEWETHILGEEGEIDLPILPKDDG